jgi:hypothetical protein
MARATSLECQVGYTDETLNIHHQSEVGTFHTKFKARGNIFTVRVKDVKNPNPADDYIGETDGEHTFTLPLYCREV